LNKYCSQSSYTTGLRRTSIPFRHTNPLQWNSMACQDY